MGDRRFGVVVAAALIVAGACAGSGNEEGVWQCSLLDPAQIRAATGATTVTEEPFHHDESGDGWWCLYVIDDTRVELQITNNDGAFSELAAVAGPNGGPVDISDDLGDGTFRRTNGIPGLVVLVGGDVISFNELDLPAPYTEAVASVAVKSCCPD